MGLVRYSLESGRVKPQAMNRGSSCLGVSKFRTARPSIQPSKLEMTILSSLDSLSWCRNDLFGCWLKECFQRSLNRGLLEMIWLKDWLGCTAIRRGSRVRVE
ncbi:MAG: hypothetical protein QXU11_06565 [Thermoproteota archaeon]